MTTEESIYKQVIDIIRKKPNLEVLFFEIAKEFPEAIVSCYARVVSFVGPELSIDEEIMKILRVDDGTSVVLGKIKAIKWLRGERKIGLKEAKEYVEDLIERTL